MHLNSANQIMKFSLKRHNTTELSQNMYKLFKMVPVLQTPSAIGPKAEFCIKGSL